MVEQEQLRQDGYLLNAYLDGHRTDALYVLREELECRAGAGDEEAVEALNSLFGREDG